MSTRSGYPDSGTKGGTGYQYTVEPQRFPSLISRSVITTDSKERKGMPFFSGVMKYFPLALLEVARVSKIGNDKHNPGEELNWSRGKSDDHMDAASRHMLDYAAGTEQDPSGSYHLANAAWRILAQLQLDMETKNASSKDTIKINNTLSNELQSYCNEDALTKLRGQCGLQSVGTAQDQSVR